jgi:drug/metabolite transporter (DMT)-like permease
VALISLGGGERPSRVQVLGIGGLVVGAALYFGPFTLGDTALLGLAIDVDGIRRVDDPGVGIERLLRSMREHPQYTPADSLALCRGFLPHAPFPMEPPAGVVDEERSP